MVVGLASLSSWAVLVSSFFFLFLFWVCEGVEALPFGVLFLPIPGIAVSSFD
jgi:hypothetical protein